MKDSFTYRREWLEQPRAVRQEVSEAIAVYGITGETIGLKPKAKAAFEAIKASMDCAELQRSRQMKELAGMRWKNGDGEAARDDDEKSYHAYRINFDAARINGKTEQSCGRISGKKEQCKTPEASRARIEVRDYLTLQREDNIESVCKGGVGERNGDTDDAAAGRHTHTH